MQDPFKPVGYRPAPPPAASRSRWRWIGIGFPLLIALLGGVVALGPSLIDWNAYKDPLAEAVGRATGRKLAIAGTLSLELLPRPRLVARTVSLGNAPDGTDPEMARVDRLEVLLAPWPLLTGRFELRRLDLIGPTILLERLPDGTGNWESVIQHLSRQGREGWLQLALERIGISNGTALYRSADGTERRLEGIDATLTQSAQGQVAIAGSGKLGLAPLRFEANLASAGGEGPLRILVSGGDGEAEVTGTLHRGEVLGFQGRLRVKTPSVARSLIALALAKAPLPAGLDQRFAAEADLRLEGAVLETSGLRLEFGGAVAGGKAELNFEARQAMLELAMSRFDLDAWPKDETGASWPELVLPADWSASARLSIEALVWQAGIISQVRTIARLEGGRIAIDEAKALLPGGSDVSIVAALEPAEGGRWRWSGRLTAASDNLRGLLRWLGADPDGVPADRLRKLTLNARLSGLGSNLDVSEIDARLDASHVTGGVAVLLRARPGFGFGLAIDQINLDAYLPRPEGGGGQDEPPTAPNLFGRLDANFNLAVAELDYAGQTLKGLRAEGTLQNGDLTLRSLSGRTASGGSARIAGRVAGLIGGSPELDLEFDLAAKNGAELVRLAGLPEPEVRLGGMSVSGTAAGKPGAVAVDVTVLAEAFDADGRIAGTVTSARPKLLGSGKVQVQLREPTKLASLMGLEPARLAALGPVSVEGDIGRDGDRLTADLTLTAPETKLTAHLVGSRTGTGNDAAIDGRFEAAAENGRPVLLALGLDPAAAPPAPVAATLTASGLLRELAVEGEAAAVEGRMTLRGRVGLQEERSYELAVSAEHPDLPRLAAVFGLRAEPLTGALALQGKVSGGEERLSFVIEPSRLGSLSASGEGDVAFVESRPKARVTLALGEIPLAMLAAPFRSGEGDAVVGAGWSTRPVDWSLLGRFDAEAALSAEAVSAGALRIETVKAELSLAGGRLALRRFEGTVAQGLWTASGTLDPEGRNTASLSLSVQGAEIGDSGEWAGLGLAAGKLDLGLDLTSRGTSAAELVQGLAGAGRLKIEGGTLRGVDLSSLADFAQAQAGAPPADAQAIAAAVEQGETPFTKLEAGIGVERGMARAADLALITPAATGHGSLSLDLLAWQSDGELQMSLIDRPELPAVRIRVAGPLDAPERSVDASALAAALAPPPEPVIEEPKVEEPTPPAEPAPQEVPAATPPQTAPEPESGVTPPPRPAPAPEPSTETSTDAFIKGILEKLNKP